MRSIILTADDFGLHPRVTDGILEAHQRGLLTSTSLLIGAPDAPRAARLSRSFQRLGVGLHLALSHVRPILPPRRLPTLVGADGRFPLSAQQVRKRLSLGLIDPEQLSRELEAQLLAALELGLALTHLDGHHGFHLHPAVLPLVLRLARRYGIRAIRLKALEPRHRRCQSGGRIRREAGLQRLGRERLGSARRLIQRAGLVCTDHTIASPVGRDLDTQHLLAILPRLKPGSTEIVLHPGLPRPLLGAGPRQTDIDPELEALLNPTVAARVRSEQLTLIHYGDLAEAQQLQV